MANIRVDNEMFVLLVVQRCARVGGKLNTFTSHIDTRKISEYMI